MIIVSPSYQILAAPEGIQALKDLELAARTCYKSEDKITGDSAIDFARRILKRKHDAMVEFAGDMNVKFVCDRGVSHELVRHRVCSFAQESTRYCDYEKAGEITVVCPIDILATRDPLETDGELESWTWNYTHPPQRASSFAYWYMAIRQAEHSHNTLRSKGFEPQIARSVLPTCLKTEINVKANLREWRHIFHQRTSMAAHPQMRELMVPLLAEVQQRIPVLFDDILNY